MKVSAGRCVTAQRRQTCECCSKISCCLTEVNESLMFLLNLSVVLVLHHTKLQRAQNANQASRLVLFTSTAAIRRRRFQAFLRDDASARQECFTKCWIRFQFKYNKITFP